MGAAAKVSVAVGRAELEWARERAAREGRSLSAFLTETLAERRRLEALAEVVDWMGLGKPPVSKAELAAANRALRSRRR